VTTLQSNYPSAVFEKSVHPLDVFHDRSLVMFASVFNGRYFHAKCNPGFRDRSDRKFERLLVEIEKNFALIYRSGHEVRSSDAHASSLDQSRRYCPTPNPGSVEGFSCGPQFFRVIIKFLKCSVAFVWVRVWRWHENPLDVSEDICCRDDTPRKQILIVKESEPILKNGDALAGDLFFGNSLLCDDLLLNSNPSDCSCDQRHHAADDTASKAEPIGRVGRRFRADHRHGDGYEAGQHGGKGYHSGGPNAGINLLHGSSLTRGLPSVERAA